MKRLHSTTVAEQGAVYRYLTGPAATDCFPPPALLEVTPPGCASWPVNDNGYAQLPTTFAPDVEIDDYPYDPRFSSLASVPEDATFVDLWNELAAPIRYDVFLAADGCYCPGDGVDRPGLTIGRPQFPNVTLLPFFRFLTASGVTSAAISSNNPVDKRQGNCCAKATDESEDIVATVINGKIRLSRRELQETPKMYRTTDANEHFLSQFGFPRFCCLPDPCDLTNPQAEYVQRWIHFPGWLSLVNNPYTPDPANAKEPVGIVPFLADIQCDTTTGDLYIYRGEMLFHDGRLFKVRWNTAAPRFDANEDVKLPPKDPNPVVPPDLTHLDYNKDYKNLELIATTGLGYQDPNVPPFDVFCQNDYTCKKAAQELSIVGCTPLCQNACPDGTVFAGTFPYTSPSNQNSEQAVAAAKAAYAALNPGSMAAPVCYILRLAEARWEIGLMTCLGA